MFGGQIHSQEEDEDDEVSGPTEEWAQIEAASNYADRLLEVAEHGSWDPNALGGSCENGVKSEFGSRERSLEEKLLELHIAESSKDSPKSAWNSHLNPCSNLLGLLCGRERCNRLVVDLLPDVAGYVISTLSKEGSCAELARLPYQETSFLTHLDNQELPSFLVDLLETKFPEGDLFYAGNVIAEVRDKRRVPPGLQGEVSHVLLRPTTKTIICDSNMLAQRLGDAHGRRLTSEERSYLESQLVMAAEPVLCLDPDPVVSLVARKAEFHRQKLGTDPMRRAARKHSQIGIGRKRKLEEQIALQPPPELKLHDFIENVKNKQLQKDHKPTPQDLLAKHQLRVRSHMKSVDPGSRPEVFHHVPLETDVIRHARAIPRREEVNDNTPHVVEEYILETPERGSQRIYHTRLTIFQRLSNEEYLGELYVERDFKENDRKGSTCRFVLGTRPHALRYINQFTEIFTEEGRKSVKITHQVPNQPPRVTLTPGMRERMQAAPSAAAELPKRHQSQTPSILQQTLQSPGVNVVQNVQQLPIHPVAPTTVRQQLVRQPAPAQAVLQHQVEDSIKDSKASGGEKDQEMEISAIMAELVKDTARFEPNVAPPQLPTCPVPPASLATAVVVTSPGKNQQQNNNNTKVVGNRVSLQNLLIEQQQQQIPGQASAAAATAATVNSNPNVKVTVSQLVAQLQRPVASLPSYSQALAQSQQVQVQQTSPGSSQQRIIVAQQTTPTRRGPLSAASPSARSHEAPGLQALLANTPSADNPGGGHGDLVGNGNASPSLLERLVSGQPVSSSPGNPHATSLSRSNSLAANPDTTKYENEITLAALLAKPSTTTLTQRTVNNGLSSPVKMSPLLQQLQQPIPPLRSMSGASPSSLPSPRRPASSPSPRATQTRSPRPSPTRQPLMQAPAGGKAASILSTQLQQPLNVPGSSAATVSSASSNGISSFAAQPSTASLTSNGLVGANGGGQQQPQNVVSLQNLLQCEMANIVQPIQVSSSAAPSGNGGATALQLQIPGLSLPVTLSVNLPQEQQGGPVNNQTPKNLVNVGGKLVTTSNSQGSGQVLFQGSTGIIQLPQQPASNVVVSSSANIIKPMTSGSSNVQTSHILKQATGGQLLQVRQTASGQQVYVVPNSTSNAGQSIQIVRSVPQQLVRTVQPQQQQQQILLNSSGLALKSPPSVSSSGALPILSPQTGASSSASSSIMSPPAQAQLMGPPGSSNESLVAIQIPAANNIDHSLHLLPGSAGSGAGPGPPNVQLNHNPAAAQIKMRQQRKQSLK